ncbi:hypothetical protein EDB83DRAFT_2673840 [Lactarius deliciosus]|nr:hypothetical protein EDB83DRAFT_2673840 [Lactarius deliciosus]
MALPSCDQDHQLPIIVEKLLAAGRPCFPVFEERRLAGVPPPEMGSAPDTLAIPDDPEDISTIELLPEGAAAAWLIAHIRSAEDIVLARIPAWAGDGATSCMFPRQVKHSWPEIEYKRIDRSEASCLRITDVRGKGKGCVAASAVPRGELVARERALLMMPRTFVLPQHAASTVATAMTPKQRAAFSALYNCKSADLGDAQGIIRTNSFLVPGMPGHNVLYSAVFETFSRINHRCDYFSSLCTAKVITSEPSASCCPNAMFRWDKETFSGEIRAMRPISEGEEVTISYFQEILEPAAVTHERQKFLLEGYNFKCTCSICARSSKARARSDDDRPIITMSVTDIGAYHREMVYDWITRGGNDHARLLNYLHTIEAALDREMIFYPTHWIYLARAVVMVRCALREAKAARKWAQRAAQHSRALTGSDGGWDAIAREPEKCGWWGTWNKPRLRGIWV